MTTTKAFDMETILWEMGLLMGMIHPISDNNSTSLRHQDIKMALTSPTLSVEACRMTTLTKMKVESMSTKNLRKRIANSIMSDVLMALLKRTIASQIILDLSILKIKS